MCRWIWDKKSQVEDDARVWNVRPRELVIFLRDAVQRNMWRSVPAPKEVCLRYFEEVHDEQL